MAEFILELIDISDSIENFKFTKVSDQDLQKVIGAFKNKADFLEFTAHEGIVLLDRTFFRGIMYSVFEEPQKTLVQENKEDSVEVSKVPVKKKIYSKPTKSGTVDEEREPEKFLQTAIEENKK
jgi:hypothetical protein